MSRSELQPGRASLPTRAMTVLRRYGRIYAGLWRTSVVREMAFKTNFLLWLVVELLWFSLQLAFIAVIYQHTDRIGDWSKWQVVLLVGASNFIQQIFQALFVSNCAELSEHVRTGRLDFMLLLPVNTRFLLSLRQVDLGSYVNAATGLAVMIYALHRMAYVPSPARLAGFLVLVGVGVLIHYSLMFLLACMSFWTTRAQGLVWGYYSLFNVARLPDAAFRGFVKAFFTFALPMLLVANVPVKLLVEKLQSPFELVLLAGMGGVCFAVSEWGWRVSVRQYTSASS